MSGAREDEHYMLAAKTIVSADFLLISVGAGMSADSGLAVYAQVANFPAYQNMGHDYRSLCMPVWLEKDPEIFFGFFGKCYNDYMDVKPHVGHHVLLNWAKEMFDKPLTEHFPNLRRYFVYSSNVDTHMEKAGFPPEFIKEIHANNIDWHCTNKESEHSSEIVHFDPNFRFDVNLTTMRANLETVPRCKNCKQFLRPSLVMFFDDAWVHRKTEYRNWISLVEKKCSGGNSKLAIIEIGCGTNVPSVRMASESKLKSIGPSTKLIRINLEFPNSDLPEQTIGIKAKAMEALLKLDKFVKEIRGQPPVEIPQSQTTLPSSTSAQETSASEDTGNSQ